MSDLTPVAKKKEFQHFLGVDTGGTFTDFILITKDGVKVHKVLSTPDSPDVAILQGIHDLGLFFENLKIVHGSTVATNALLQAKGAKTVYVGNKGLADLLLIGRQARPMLYDLQPEETFNPVNRNWCLEISGRISAEGDVIEPLCRDDIDGLVAEIKAIDPDSVAINLLFSYLDSDHEQAIADALPKHLYVSCSSSILPEYKEYERGMATWLNAYVGPLVKDYLNKLTEAVAPAKVSVMLSSGGTASADLAANKAVQMLLSGPAGGLQAAQHIGDELGFADLLTFDMGGTSTDVALLSGDISLSNDGFIAGLPVAIPSVDMHTIGAGGGSLATVDGAGMLHVGPDSAGAKPGPACYNQGGTQATVTDANVVLGRLPGQVSLAGDLELNKEKSVASIKKLSTQLQCSVEEAAMGILKIANEHMSQALRVISVHRGVDVKDFALMSFGGAGGLHVCDLAESMMMKTAIVPLNAGVLSAFGMLVAPISRDLVLTKMIILSENAITEIAKQFEQLVNDGMRQMLAEGLIESEVSVEKKMDLRYRGQSFTLCIPWQDMHQCAEKFHETHLSRYGHKLDEVIELVNLRVRLVADSNVPRHQNELFNTETQACNTTKIYGATELVKIWRRTDLPREESIIGPAIIIESNTTIFVKHGWTCCVMQNGHLRLTKNE